MISLQQTHWVNCLVSSEMMCIIDRDSLFLWGKKKNASRVCDMDVPPVAEHFLLSSWKLQVSKVNSSCCRRSDRLIRIVRGDIHCQVTTESASNRLLSSLPCGCKCRAICWPFSPPNLTHKDLSFSQSSREYNHPLFSTHIQHNRQQHTKPHTI